jgi:hypothetical protein
MDRINLPRFVTNPVRHPMSLILWWSRTSSYRCIWLYAVHSARITCLSWSIPHVERPLKIYWTAPNSREQTGLHSRLASKTHTRGIPWQTTRRQSTSASRGWPEPSKRPQRHLLPIVYPVPTRGPLYPLVFRMKYTWRTGRGGSGKSRRIRWNHWTMRTSRYGR